jgi:hypothetical protein
MLNNKALAASLSAGPKTYIEDVFSTFLYTGNGSSQTITNGIDLSGKGGLVWTKSRSSAFDHRLYDTIRGVQNSLSSNATTAANTTPSTLTAFNVDGFTLGGNDGSNLGGNGVSWTFRKAPKFFDVVTYAGTGSAQTIAHNLGSVPGCIIVKRTDSSGYWWAVYHRSLSSASNALLLQETGAQFNAPTIWNSTPPTSSNFSVGTSADTNASGGTYVAYLFAHDAGGFGDSGNDNVISCGSFTTDGSGAATVTLGWEPQWVLFKRSNASAGGSQDRWQIIDNLRGLGTAGTTQQVLFPNTSDLESAWPVAGITSTGFATTNAGYVASSSTFIYIAIRRGPMKTPTDATKVFTSIAVTASTGTQRTIGFPSDFCWARKRTVTSAPTVIDRLRGYSSTSGGSQPGLETTNTGAENAFTTALLYDIWNTTAKDGANFNGASTLFYHFRRAPGFFDVVAYTGTGSARTVSHSLGAVPELIVVKLRSGIESWAVYSQSLPASNRLRLNLDAAAGVNNSYWNSTAPTNSVFTVGTDTATNASSSTYIAYLFATCPGVSKVGAYTGTGTTLNIDCGFTNGARFVLIKRTDSTGDWYVWDTARGIISADDPYLLLNSTAAEVTNTDYIDPLSSGFQISSTAPAAINASGGSYIYLSVA